VGKPVLEVVAATGLCASKGEARRLMQQGGLTVNNVRVGDVAAVFEASMLIEGRLTVLRSGKKNNRLLKVC
jgi:tyrosyl-tRNA synthetase